LGNRGLRVRQEPGPFVAIAGLAHQTYGHWLIDHLPKLWVLEQCGIDIDHVRFLLPSTLQTFAREWLRLLGIRDEQLVFYDWRSEAVEAEELILPTVMRFESVASPLLQQAAVMLLERTIAGGGLSPANTDDLPERLYIPRAPGAYRALINREEIEERAVAAGFAIVRPAQLPIVEQIALFRNARQVIGEYGSALHNTLFSRPGTVVAALRGSQPEPWYLQSGIGRALDQPTGYVFGRTNTDDPSMSYTVDPDDFADCLRLVLSQ
jgi:capsular polysaccharide biosynthesis protein